MANKSAIICVMDGWGIAPEGEGNPITLAHPKTFEHLWSSYPHSILQASGVAVGLPEGQMGNSETGHLNIGAGRIVFQDLAVINQSIADGSFFTNRALLDTVKHLNSFGSDLHLVGLIGGSGVHAYNDHLYALLMFARHHNIKNVYLHLITDGRDSPPQNAVEQITKVEEQIKRYQTGVIASVMGRYYAMDRDQRLDRTKKAYDCLVNPHQNISHNITEYLNKSYTQGIFDEFIVPAVTTVECQNSRIKAADAVIFFNFRTDRARQLTDLFLNSQIPNLRFVTMTRYRKDFENPVMFPTSTIKETLGEVLSRQHFNQLRASESEKEAMVTYYFNGQNEVPFSGETHLFVPSPKIATYDLQPAMSTEKLIAQFSEAFSSVDYSLGVINIACPDMVAHTGKIEQTEFAIHATDLALASLIELCKKKSSYLLITADHGNAEELLDSQGGINTEHSTNPVPFIIYHPDDHQFELSDGVLGDIAPTVLDLLDLPQPSVMTGKNMIRR